MGDNIKTMQTDTTNTSDAQIATNVSSANKNDDGPPNASPSTNTTTSAAPAPRAKINISLKKKSKPKKSSNNNSLQKQQLNTNGTTSLLADEYSTIAEEAEIISQRRKEQGSVLVIPCKQSTNEEDKRKQPLLAGRLALLRKGDGEEDGESTTAAVESNVVDNKSEEGGTNNGISNNNGNTDTVDDEAMKELIQSAEQRDKTKHDTNDKAAATSHGRGLVIAAPSENKLTTRSTADTNSNTTTSKTTHGRNEIMNDEEVFKHELSHHAPDVDPTSNVYANISIGDFGSALLRGMGWTGGSSSASTNNNNKQLGGGGKDDEIVKPRPHRLGLGAKPLPLPSTSTSSSSKARSSGGIHRRARRPEDVKRDEERLRQQEEAEKILEEKKKLDVQYTLQNGSIVTVREDIIADTLNGGDKQNGGTRRALILQTAGVPGLNRILIQLEGEQKGISVTKNSVSLCSWEELEKHPFKKTPLMKEKKKGEQSSGKKEEREYGRNGARKRDRSYSDDDNGGRYDERRRKDDRRRDHKHYSEEEEDDDDDPRDDDSYNCRRSSKKHKRRKKDRRSRSRSDSRERRSGGGRRRKDSRKDRRRGRSRSPEEQRKRSKHHDLHHSSPHNHHQQQLNWLIPHIRVRLISKKIPKYYLQKGIIQDVMQPTQSSSSSSGPKAVILMENGQVLDKVPERYLETALPKAGGHVIILESKDESHHWKKGRLLEKSSKDGYGIIQLEEDLEVVKVSLDGIAEWCGDQLE